MKNNEFTARTKARKRAIDILFEADQKGICGDTESILELLQQRKVISPAMSPLPAYSEEIVTGVAQNIAKIDDTISTYSQNYALDRIASTDRAILRVGVWEILFEKDVDTAVKIDEAATIAKAISTDQSPVFINGLLDAIAKAEK